MNLHILMAARQPGRKTHGIINQQKLWKLKKKIARAKQKTWIKNDPRKCVFFFHFERTSTYVHCFDAAAPSSNFLWLKKTTICVCCKCSYTYVYVSICLIVRFSFTLSFVACVHDRNDILAIHLACGKLLHKIMYLLILVPISP